MARGKANFSSPGKGATVKITTIDQSSFNLLEKIRLMAVRYPVKIKAAPKVGSLYWCSLHPESTIHLPEFWKKRPVVVISRKNSLHGKVIVLPVTTDEDNESYEHSIELSKDACDKINGKRCWVVCDHPMTVATSRLDFVHKSPPRITRDELEPILDKCHSLIAG